MPNRGRRKKWCLVCGRHVSECGSLSARGKCLDCGEEAQLENVRELAAHSGPRFDHWLARCRAAFGVAASEVGRPHHDEEVLHVDDL